MGKNYLCSSIVTSIISKLTKMIKKTMATIKTLFNAKFWIFLYIYCLVLTAMIDRNYKRAIIYFERCIKLENNFDRAGLIYEQLGKCYFGINELEKSKFHLLKTLEFRKEGEKINSEISSRLGFIFFQESKFKEAKYYLELAKRNYKKIDYTNIEAVNDYLLKLIPGS